jgi:adenine-specific DNA-methyltransferase
MVQAYRDTWELGLHSYLTYLRDRLLLARELLTTSGSVFVQISDENLHHLREVMDEVFGAENYAAQIVFKKTGASSGDLFASSDDHILWYARELAQVKFHPIFLPRKLGDPGTDEYKFVELSDGAARPATPEELAGITPLPAGARAFRPTPLTSSHGYSLGKVEVQFAGRQFIPGPNRYWSTHPAGIQRCADSGRLIARGEELAFKRYLNDFAVLPASTNWQDTMMSSRSEDKVYVVQTSAKVLQRCINATTDPGDLVLDPTCGSGTTAYVAEQWGRRWITIDTSRVPLALTRQRLLTATFPWYELKDDQRGPAGGFVYKRKQNSRGEEVGGIFPHVTLKSIANDEPPAEEVLVDRPEEVRGVTRVTGPFVFEATIPTPVDFDGDGVEDNAAGVAAEHGSFVERMLEVLRRSPLLQLGGGRAVALRNIRPPARALSLSAEAVVEGEHPVAFVFGPENGAVSDKLVYNAAREAHAKHYTHLYVIGFAIEPGARELVEQAEGALGVPATYVQATPDLMMGDLLKTMRSSQIFSVCGQPDVELLPVQKRDRHDPDRYQARLLGVDTFDPVTNEVTSLEGNDVPAWLLDTDYNDLVFHVRQAFFPRTGAWENLRKALRADYEESVWDHLNGTTSAEFEATPGQKVAVKVIDNRGNELMVVKTVGVVGP